MVVSSIENYIYSGKKATGENVYKEKCNLALNMFQWIVLFPKEIFEF